VPRPPLLLVQHIVDQVSLSTSALTCGGVLMLPVLMVVGSCVDDRVIV
jgi:hypothetical protein